MCVKCSEPFRDLKWKWIFNSLVILGELVYIEIDPWAAYMCYRKVLDCSKVLVEVVLYN